MIAAFQWADPHLAFAEGYTLSTRDASLVAEHTVGRMLSLTEVHRLSIRFETAAPQYAWLNTSLFVGRGRLLGTGHIEYQIFRVG